MIPKLNDKIFCGLDIGESRLKACLLKSKGAEQNELLGVFEVPTQGFKDSSITDIGEFSECIATTVSGLSRKTGIKIKDILLGINGKLIESRLSTAVMPLIDRGSKMINSADVKKAITQASLLGLQTEEEILHEFPLYYKVDQVNFALNPIGLSGRKLEVGLFLILSQLRRLNNLTQAVHQAGYEIEDIFFSSLGAAESVLPKKVRTEGCVLVDIGAQFSSILVFKDGLLKHLDFVEIGGDRFTRTIARTLNIAFDLAEDIKKSYCSALTAEIDGEEEILIKKDAAFVPLKRITICEAIEMDVEALVQGIHHGVCRSKLTEELSGGIIMTGGGSLLSGILERVEAKTGMPVSIGKINLADTRLNNAALYSACIGLVLQRLNPSDHPSVTASHAPMHWSARLGTKIKEIYQDYF